MDFDFSQNFAGMGQQGQGQNFSFRPPVPPVSGSSGCPNFTNALSGGFFNHAGFSQQYASIMPNQQWNGSSPSMPTGPPPTPSHVQTLDWAPALEKSGLQATILPSRMAQHGGDASYSPSPMGGGGNMAMGGGGMGQGQAQWMGGMGGNYGNN